MHMNFKDMTIAVLRDHRPDLVAEIEAAARAPVEKERDEAAAKAKIDASLAQAAVKRARREAEAEQTAAPAQSEPASVYKPEAMKAEWQASDKLKAEFPEAEDYAAFRRADVAGKVRILQGNAAA